MYYGCIGTTESSEMIVQAQMKLPESLLRAEARELIQQLEAMEQRAAEACRQELFWMHCAQRAFSEFSRMVPWCQ